MLDRLAVPVLGALLLVALALAGQQWFSAQHARAETRTVQGQFDAYRTEATRQALQVANNNALESARRNKVHAEVLHAQVQQTEAARVAAVHSAAADGSLRSELARVAARGRAAAADPAAVADREAAAAASAVLADLLGRCSERRAELADYADRARIAGEACQLSYEALTP